VRIVSAPVIILVEQVLQALSLEETLSKVNDSKIFDIFLHSIPHCCLD
jgi:hypothetical protein